MQRTIQAISFWLKFFWSRGEGNSSLHLTVVALHNRNLHSKAKSNNCPKTSYESESSLENPCCSYKNWCHLTSSEQELSQKGFFVCFLQACTLENSWTLVAAWQLPVQQLSPVTSKSGHFCVYILLSASTALVTVSPWKLAVMTNAVITAEIIWFRKELHSYPDK